jgi:hypothetical protein
MSVRHTLFAAATIAIAATASPASGQTLRYANQGDLKSLDPYTLRKPRRLPIMLMSMRAWSPATRI